MKSWTDRQVFFIFDTEFCQNEEDDPKDAIVYFRPQETSESIRCTLCCQLMGISRFLKHGFSPVSLIRLDKGKFAIKSIGKYILALNGNQDMPDSILQRQLNRVISLFRFHFKDFDTVQKDCLNSRQVFLEKMMVIWNVLISISQQNGNTLNLTFSLMSVVDLPKTAGILHLQAAQLLQACQWHQVVLAGCIMYNYSVLHSQLPTSVLHNLTSSLTNDKKVLPSEVVKVKFELPGGVTLTYVYLTKQELNELSRSITNIIRKVHDNSKSKETSKEFLVAEELEKRVEPINQECIILKETEANATTPFKLVSSLTAKPNTDSSLLDSTFAYDSCKETFDKTKDQLKIVNNELRENMALMSEKQEDKVLPDSLNFSTGAALEDGHDNDTQNDSETRNLSADESTNCLEFTQFVLFVQHCNDSILALLMDDQIVNEAEVIHSLWKLGMNSVTALERDVKNCLEMTTTQDPRHKLKYHYLQYEKKWQSAKGNLFSPDKHVTSQHSFSRQVQLIHEEFGTDSDLQEITLRTNDHIIYSHQMGSKETFYQQNCQNEDGMAYMPFPRQNDFVATIATIAKRRLEIDHKIIIL